MAYYSGLSKTTEKVSVVILVLLSITRVRGTLGNQTISRPNSLDHKEDWHKTKVCSKYQKFSDFITFSTSTFTFLQTQDALELGREDNTSMVHVSVMIYYTRELKNIVTDPIMYIENLVQESNNVFENSEVPVRLQVHCKQELDIGEDPNRDKMQGGANLEKNTTPKKKFQKLIFQKCVKKFQSVNLELS